MNKHTFFAGAALSLVLAATAQAADAVVAEPAAPAIVESRVKGAVEIGGWANYFSQTDNDVSDTNYGIYGAAFAHIDLGNSFFLGVDAQGEKLSLDDEFYLLQPDRAGVIGTSLNYRLDAGAIGAFAGIGATNHRDENGVGYVAGVQGSFDFNAATVFGQVGYADIRVDDDLAGFVGGFGKAGVIYGFTDSLAFLADAGFGHTEDFTGEDVAGTYWTVGLKGALKLTDTLPLFGTAGYEYRRYESDQDAFDHSFRIGLSYAFGGATTAKDSFNPFQTPIAPFRAAAYGEVLD